MKAGRIALLFSFPCLAAAPALAQAISGGTCSTSSLNGTYTVILGGRAISAAGNFSGSYQAIGTATFDGQGNVTLTGTANTNLAQGSAFSYTGTYSLPSNCYGTLAITTTSAATFSLVVWSGGKQFAMTGSDGTYVYSVSGSDTQPDCATATLSGEYTYTASGFTKSGSTQTGAAEESGVFEFDGMGSATVRYTVSSGGTAQAALSATGNYTVNSTCLGSATMAASNGDSNTLNFVVTGAFGQAFDLIETNSEFVRTGSAHSAFSNPSQSIANAASYAVGATPPGSVFVVFGFNFANGPAAPTAAPLPTRLLNTTVTVNGELAPLFYINPGQIDAQMPWDIQGGGVASVVVKNGPDVSNAAAVFVPATGTPGISVYGNHRAVVVNPKGKINSGAAPARVGDELVVYFTGGGPVKAAGKLNTGEGAPNGLSPVTGENSITVGGIEAKVVYMGLTPEAIGLYQANFIVPQIAKGTYPLVITIAGYASNNPVISVSN